MGHVTEMGRRRFLAMGLAFYALHEAQPVRADDREASIHVELGPASLRVEDLRAQGAIDSIAAMLLAIRGTYGLNDYVAVEARLGLLAGNDARFSNQALASGASGTVRQDERGVRATIGATARLGVAWIPTLTALAGVQRRYHVGGYLLHATTDTGLEAIPSTTSDEIILGAAIGLDHRFDAHWVIGVSLQALHGVPLDDESFGAIELPIHASYYWYP